MNLERFLSACCGILLLCVLEGCEQHLSAGFAVGEHAPSLPTKTLADAGGNFSKVTTYRQPDARMYQYSIDQALLTGKPIVLEFATPGHCTNCDEQLQMFKSIMDTYEGKMIFIHIDQYENPQAYKAYRVMGDPWTFIIDKKGIVRFERAGRMLIGELDGAIKQIL
ncbi:MAG: thioredoxin family protein [Gallionella sp.]|nr:thioredoxin family protein [Gallionella sp.]